MKRFQAKQLVLVCGIAVALLLFFLFISNGQPSLLLLADSSISYSQEIVFNAVKKIINQYLPYSR